MLTISYSIAGLLLIAAFLAWLKGNSIEWQRKADRYYGLFGVLVVSAMGIIALATITQ